MSYFNPSLLLSSYETSSYPSAGRWRISSTTSLDSWVLDVTSGCDEENDCSMNSEFAKPEEGAHFQRSISLQEKWLYDSSDNAFNALFTRDDNDSEICVNSDDNVKVVGTMSSLIPQDGEKCDKETYQRTTLFVDPLCDDSCEKNAGSEKGITYDQQSREDNLKSFPLLNVVVDKQNGFEEHSKKEDGNINSKGSILNQLFSTQRTLSSQKINPPFYNSAVPRNQKTSSEKKPKNSQINESENNSQGLFTNKFFTASKLRYSSSQVKPKHNEQQVQMKTKIRSMWNNMKYGWRIKRDVNLKTDSPLWLLGQSYHAKLHDIPDGSCSSMPLSTREIAKERFKEDLNSRIWLTYRLNFPTIPGTNFETDSGWGCMLRAGQMMMAQGLLCHFLSRAWRLSSVQTKTTETLHRMIIRWFGDTPSPESPFSLHQLVSLGKIYGRKAGDWYGPTHAAHVLRKALKYARKANCKLDDICMYVASDGIIFKQDIIDLCTSALETPLQPKSSERNSTIFTSEKQASSQNQISETELHDELNKCSISGTASAAPENEFEFVKKEDITASRLLKSSSSENTIFSVVRSISECEEADESLPSLTDHCPNYSECISESFLYVPRKKWRSLILFVSVRLGNDKLNPFYIPCLKSLLAYEHCIGIIGGRPKHAVYFVGWQDDKLIHLDPHNCQTAVDVQNDDFSDKSFHCSTIRTMSFSDMDPSCAIGFYFRTQEEFDYFSEKISEIAAPMKKNLDYPVFGLAEGRRAEAEQTSLQHQTLTAQGYPSSSERSLATDDDDYIML